MKPIYNFVLLFAIFFLSCSRQNPSQLKFSMASPDKWIKTSNEELYDNLNNFKLTQAQLDKCISDHKGSVLFVSYSKYDRTQYQDLIPMVQVNIRENLTRTFDSFFQSMEKSIEPMRNVLNDFEYIDNPQKIKIDGKDAFYFSAKFTMKSDSQTVYARSRTYAIPNGSSFFQINFNDGDNEDCTAIFDSLVKSIKLN